MYRPQQLLWYLLLLACHQAKVAGSPASRIKASNLRSDLATIYTGTTTFTTASHKTPWDTATPLQRHSSPFKSVPKSAHPALAPEVSLSAKAASLHAGDASLALPPQNNTNVTGNSHPPFFAWSSTPNDPSANSPTALLFQVLEVTIPFFGVIIALVAWLRPRRPGERDDVEAQTGLPEPGVALDDL